MGSPSGKWLVGAARFEAGLREVGEPGRRGRGRNRAV